MFGKKQCRLGAIPRGGGGRAFTLVELLVVIAVIGILAALLLPVLSSAKQRALRIKCLSNVKQLDLIFIEYAHDNNDRLPHNSNTFNMLWPFVSVLADPVFDAWNFNQNGTLGITLRNNYGLKPGILECPAKMPGTNFTYQFDFPFNPDYGWRMPYVVALDSGSIAPTNRNITIAQQFIQMKINGPGGMGGDFVSTDPSRRVLVADSSHTSYDNHDPALWQTYDWRGPTTTWWFTAHVDKRNKVIGANDGMLDGHAQWVKARDLRPASSRSGDNPPFSADPCYGWTLWW